MSSISSSSKGLRKRWTVRVRTASAFVLLAGALLPTAASAYVYPRTIYFDDGTYITTQAACTPKTYANPSPRTWFETAMQRGPAGDFWALRFPYAKVAFGIYDVGRGRWVVAESSWRTIPKTTFGLNLQNLPWYWGSGSFQVWAVFSYGGVTYGWYQIGSMRWLNGLCFDY